MSAGFDISAAAGGAAATAEEAAAAIAAIEQFLGELTPAVSAGDGPSLSGWQRAALNEGVGSFDNEAIWN